jgi:phosphoribosyl 1,2-cyclic phosphodiesterase
MLIDTGTGAREFGDKLMQESNGPIAITVIYSHLHMDHIQGLPFFGPIYESDTQFKAYCPQQEKRTSRQFFEWHMSNPWFPVDLKNLGAKLEFSDVTPGTCFEVGPARISTCPMNHPGGAMAIRVDHRGHAFVQASDTEHVGTQADPELSKLAQGADFLSYDSTYVEGPEYEEHKGWGHSTWSAGLRVAEAANVGRFIAFHHDPSHDDTFMDGIARDMEAVRPGSLVAKEGMLLDLLSGEVGTE